MAMSPEGGLVRRLRKFSEKERLKRPGVVLNQLKALVSEAGLLADKYITPIFKEVNDSWCGGKALPLVKRVCLIKDVEFFHKKNEDKLPDSVLKKVKEVITGTKPIVTYCMEWDKSIEQCLGPYDIEEASGKALLFEVFNGGDEFILRISGNDTYYRGKTGYEKINDISYEVSLVKNEAPRDNSKQQLENAVYNIVTSGSCPWRYYHMGHS